MYRKTYYATHPESIHSATNEDLRELYLVEELFAGGENLDYTDMNVLDICRLK